MSDTAIDEEQGALARSHPAPPRFAPAWVRPDGRRTLQLVLATLWLLDGILQLQSFFFTKSFGLQMISGMSSGNPSIIARPISWSGTVIGHHAVLTDAVFAVIQCGIGLAVAWRPVVKVGLAASIVWALGVWWIGEGFGGVLNGTADPYNGAPGAVILYALLAVLLWPTGRTTEPAPFIAARAMGAAAARGIWLVLWGSLAYLVVVANRAPRGLHDWLRAEAGGEPSWIVWMDHRMAGIVDHRGAAVAAVSAVILAAVAVSTYLTRPLANGFIIVAIVVSAAVWVVGENFGALFTNGATDVNSGPPLILLAIAYWRPYGATLRSPAGLAVAIDGGGPA